MGFTIGISRGMRDIRSGSRRRGRTSDVHRRGRVHRTVGLGRGAGRPGLGGRLLLRPSDCPAPGAHPLDFAPRCPGRGDAGRRDQGLGASSPAPR